MTPMAADSTIDTPVRRTITVKASPARAFDVFTAGVDTWWPRSHHIGSAPMQRAVIEGRAGGRCYSEQTDGTECDWGSILVWDPPHRFVMAWQITPTWQYEPQLARSSEVEVLFTPLADGSTRVDLEHRHFGRHGAGGEGMRKSVESDGGWGTLLGLFAARANEAA
jgi:uncharacterized protein YndB with AHSA1/START domain